MLTRYCLLLSLDELHKLPQEAKVALAKLDPEFAVVCGIPTEANPAPPPTNPRPAVAQPDGTTVLMPERNQPNQQDSPHYAAFRGGAIPGMPTASSSPMPPSMVVPMATPQSTGVPQSIQQSASVPGPIVGGQIPGSPVQPQPQFNPAPSPPPQQGFTPQPQFNPTPQAAPAAAGQMTVDYVRHTLVPQKLAELGPPATLNLIAKAHQMGIIERNSLDCLTPQNLNAFVDVLMKG